MDTRQDFVVSSADRMDDRSNWIKVDFGGHTVLMSKETLELYGPESLTLKSKQSGMLSSHPVKEKPSPEPASTHQTSFFENIPDEMLSVILQFMETKDLIQSCRLVSKRWKKFSSKICRKRFVSFKDSKWPKTQNSELRRAEIFAVFDMENLPWSSCYFFAEADFPSKSDIEFFKYFGKNIWRLVLFHEDELCNKIVGVLCQAPNLRHLQILDRSGRGWSKLGMSGVIKGVRFDKLKYLEIKDLNDFNLQLLKFIISDCGAKLDNFKANIKLTTSELVRIAASLLNGVPRISLDVFYNDKPFVKIIDLQALAVKMEHLHVQEIRLSLKATWELATGNYAFDAGKRGQHVISIPGKYLEKLTIYVPSNGHSQPFKIPSSPFLTFFSVQFHFYIRELPPMRNVFLSLLETNQFPVLKEVHLRDLGKNLLDLPCYFPENCQFDSVTKLKIEGASTDKWNRVFPNLKSLDANYYLCGPDEPLPLLLIFSYTGLEHLKIAISSEDLETGVDMNAVFSGFKNPDAIYQKSEEVIERERQIHCRPSILQLTNLKTLEIELHPSEWEDTLRDSGACLSVLQLHPLDLKLSNVELTEECEAKLGAHHRTFAVSWASSRRYRRCQ